MARSRNIKPGFYKNEDLAECSVWARYIFPGLWMLADRDGLLEDRPRRIKAELLPFDAQEADPLLVELDAKKLIQRYQNEDGSFIWIPGFKAHQAPHYSEKASGIKPPQLPVPDAHEAAHSPEHSESPPRKTREKAPIKGGSQPPDSLIPSSLNPESLESAASRVPTPPPPEPSARCASLRSICEANRVVLNARGRMHLGQWATEGVTDEQFTQAIAIARDRKPDPELIPLAYLVPIVADLRAGRIQPPQASAADAAEAAMASIAAKRPDAGETWWVVPARIVARAREEGVRVIPDQPFEEFTARVLAAAGPGPWADAQPETIRARIEHWRAVGINP